ncbi:helix-turn-helix domain-containing protein [Streptomyces sioyaensis]|uniref:helix-turn-helix domain-containing protein n=1 Tax=Streptomyces sioyaensis TaxID=67364 RepID=UPI0037CDDAAC
MANGVTWRGKPRTEERQKFFELVNSGVSIKGAGQIVGINRRTGQEWVDGRTSRAGTTNPGRKEPTIAPRRTTGPQGRPPPARLPHGEPAADAQGSAPANRDAHQKTTDYQATKPWSLLALCGPLTVAAVGRPFSSMSMAMVCISH